MSEGRENLNSDNRRADMLIRTYAGNTSSSNGASGGMNQDYNFLADVREVSDDLDGNS